MDFVAKMKAEAEAVNNDNPAVRDALVKRASDEIHEFSKFLFKLFEAMQPNPVVALLGMAHCVGLMLESDDFKNTTMREFVQDLINSR